MARRRLRARFDESAAAFGYLPKTFTLEQLRKAAEIVAGERLDPRSFRRRVLALELIEEIGKTPTGARRPARLYRARRTTNMLL
jgi:8-oxo-dGTP diphosphatase